MPSHGIGLEIGVGTGRFAPSLNIGIGIEPARRMGAIAKERGIEVVEGYAEYLPFANASFDFATLVTTLCFVRDPLASLQEAKRVIRPGGRLIIGMLDSESPLGRTYQSKRHESKFYRNAVFLTIGQVIAWLEELDFCDIITNQTIFGKPEDMINADTVKEGHGEGQFAGIRATR
jgi:ubiquinone/menaquinone biosynthesis C-methylase UbiE